jgi:hypothetical protein
MRTEPGGVVSMVVVEWIVYGQLAMPAAQKVARFVAP